MKAVTPLIFQEKIRSWPEASSVMGRDGTPRASFGECDLKEILRRLNGGGLTSLPEVDISGDILNQGWLYRWCSGDR